ncbi:MAG TPA: helix-turn-helix transcriptional regulator [Devosia sp.]|nr:helix-turn-helix transcriptional regulator [Devosia sp.]
MKRSHPDELRDILARNLRLLRAQKSMSQEVLAFESGINRTYLSDVERSIRNVSLDNISRLAKALGVPAWRLLQDAEKSDQPPAQAALPKAEPSA